VWASRIGKDLKRGRIYVARADPRPFWAFKERLGRDPTIGVTEGRRY